MEHPSRPPIYWKSVVLGGPVLLASAALLIRDGITWVVWAALIVGVAAFFGPWVLYPYSKVARRLAKPSEADFDKWQRVADRIGKIPIFGIFWRWAQRLTAPTVARQHEDYWRWRKSHDSDEPRT